MLDSIARGVRLDIRTEGKFLRVTSPDIPGLHLCSEDHPAVMGDIIPAIKFLDKHRAE